MAGLRALFQQRLVPKPLKRRPFPQAHRRCVSLGVVKLVSEGHSCVTQKSFHCGVVLFVPNFATTCFFLSFLTGGDQGFL